MNIEWAPAKVPLQRRLQTLTAGLYVFFTLMMPITSVLIIAALLLYGNLWLKFCTVLYLQYVYFNHTYAKSVINGIGLWFMRCNYFNKTLREYFPIELKKTVDLSPDRNYIIASFPHGIISTGVTVNMGNDITKWLELYPGIRPKIATLVQFFYVPIFREILRLWGFVPVSKESLLYYLQKSNDPNHKDNHDGFTSYAVTIIIGGSHEALDSHPGQYILTVKSRKGFVKLAIRTGSPIVPSFSFGEVDIFDQVDNPPNSWLRRWQLFSKRLTGIPPALVLGRGFFQYSIGLLPQRKPITQVLGAPIEVEKNENPDPKYVDEIHQKFMDALNDLFETHKTKYLENANDIKLVLN